MSFAGDLDAHLTAEEPSPVCASCSELLGTSRDCAECSAWRDGSDSTVEVRNTMTLGVVVVCPACTHQVNGKPVTSQEWTDTNGDVYFSASKGENANALQWFIQQHESTTDTS